MGSRKKKSAEIETGSLLLMMMISLTIILLAFFILLNSIARESEDRKLIALGSISKSFNILAGGDSLFEIEGDDTAIELLQMDNEYIDFSDLAVDEETLTQKLQVFSDKRGSLVRISAHELFDAGSVNLKPESYELLNALANVIKKNNYPVDIAGHTDKFPIDDSGVVSNREFSMRWALSVLDYLIEKGAVSPERLTAFGWGDCRPAVSGKSRQSREVNDRVDFIVVHPKQQKKPKGSFIFKDFFFEAFE